MTYRVEVTHAAEAELEALSLWVVNRAPSQGAVWLNGLERAVLALHDHPGRCPVAPEGAQPDRPTRLLRHGRKPHVCMVFFTVDTSKRVLVVHVRYGVRQPPTLDDVKERRIAG